jgi:predicted dehydrogenase
VDLIQYLTGAEPLQVYAQTMNAAGQYLSEDNLVITLKMSDGSAGTITYTASGDKAFPRERVEVFRGGAAGLIDNFKMASFTYQGRTYRKRNLLAVNRGHQAEMEAFISAVRNGCPAPVSLQEYVLTTLTTFSIVAAMQKGEPVEVLWPAEFPVYGRNEP